MKKGKFIGRGVTSEVYEWGQDKVLKLYFERYGDERVEYDANIGHIIHEAGVCSPAVFETVDIKGRKGIILQRIFGKSILNHIVIEPWNTFCYLQKMARLHSRIHKCSTDGLPSQKESIALKIESSKEILGDKVKRILDYLKGLPDGDRVCHGDLHFHNIIVSGNELIPIDWANAYKGNPSGDIARTYLMISSPIMIYGNLDMAKLSSIPGSMVARYYINVYMKFSNIKKEDIDAWILPMAAAKLKDKRPGEKKWLMDIIDKRLKLIGK